LAFFHGFVTEMWGSDNLSVAPAAAATTSTSTYVL